MIPCIQTTVSLSPASPCINESPNEVAPEAKPGGVADFRILLERQREVCIEESREVQRLREEDPCGTRGETCKR